MTQLKIMPLAPCGFVGMCMASPQSYSSSLSSWRTPSAKTVADHAMQQLETARKKDLETHEGNLPAIENNKAVRAAVEALMEAIGMPKSYSQRDTRSRSRYPKTIRTDAGYLSDLQREVKIDDGFEQASRTYEGLRKRYADYAEAASRETEKAQAAREREEETKRQERRANIELAQIVLRYELDQDSDWPEVLEALRAKDKRLDLAIAMQDTRGDWSDGPYRVSAALGRFTIETDIDKEIVRGVSAGLIDFEDGRVFRDMAYSYDAIFGLIENQQLVKDAQLARERSGRDS